MHCRSFQTAIALLIAAALDALPCSAQTVQGVVVSDKSHTPIGRAQLSLVDDSGHVAARDIADSASGSFYLSTAAPGHYRVKILLGHGGVSYSPPFDLDSSKIVEHLFAVPDFSPAVLDAYLPEDVTKPAAYKPRGFPGPRYPDKLRASGRSGVVRAQFVVDRNGRADMSTFRVIETDDDAFTRSVRDAVARFEFAPAELNGAPVPQVFEMGVEFRLGNTPFRLHGNNVITITATPAS
jgi:TonB family protein